MPAGFPMVDIFYIMSINIDRLYSAYVSCKARICGISNQSV